jgi:ribonuclease PH
VRSDGRAADQLRAVSIEPGYLAFADGSVLIALGRTRVICAATIEDRVPPWMRGRGTGWITAEYAMLPQATPERNQREATKGRLGGRTHEIQRLVGRALRAVVDLGLLGERSVLIDCDVIGADGGTRTASITGAWVALGLALRKHFDPAKAAAWPLRGQIAAVSVGIVDGAPGASPSAGPSSTGCWVWRRAGSGTCSTSSVTRSPVVDRERLAALVAAVGAFHVTDRGLRAAQARIAAALAAGEVEPTAVRAYLSAVRRYFEPYEREARGQLRHVDRELERLYQLQYNLAAERGVVGRRIEAVRGVLDALAEVRRE